MTDEKQIDQIKIFQQDLLEKKAELESRVNELLEQVEVVSINTAPHSQRQGEKTMSYSIIVHYRKPREQKLKLTPKKASDVQINYDQ